MWLGDAEVCAVILINLLPHREARRQERKRAFISGLGLAAVIGIGILAIWYGVLQQMISVQQDRNRFLGAEIKKLDEQIKDIATLRAEIDALKARQQAVEDLQTDRNVPVYLLDDLTKQTPEGIYLTSLRQNGNDVAITGLSLTNERVSEFLRNTAYNATWLEKPELVEIKSSNAQIGRDPKKLFEFTMRVAIKRPQAPSKSASGASPASAPRAARGS
jgi:type IV pilus assembly protein PilN